MKLFNNYPFSLEIHFVKPDLNFTSRWRNFIIVKMGTSGSMKRLRTAALRTSVGRCQHHSWSVAQPETGGTQGHKRSRWCKIQVQPWSDAVSELSAGLWTQAQNWGTATKEHSSTKCHATRQVVCPWPPYVFRLSGAQPNPELTAPSCLGLVRNDLKTP